MPWWRTDEYIVTDAMPVEFEEQCGPKGPALVKSWPSGMTDPGWGLQGKDGKPGFIENYSRDEFNARKVLYGYERDKWAFAFVMRSVRMVCIDIDGKNGGLEHAKRLGQLTPTLAETSKSGDGYHLFYRTDEEWDDVEGFGQYHDHIGVEQGVDIRSTGCVYHHKQQRWNVRDLAPLPDHLAQMLLSRRQKHQHSSERITKVIQSGDEMETLMLHDELVSDLKKPVAQGKRNTTLFAIGQKMKQAGVDEWEKHIETRALDLGLDSEEVDQLLRNIARYN